MKFLLWLVVGFAAVTWLLRGKKTISHTPAAAPDARAKGVSEPMVECAQCGMHIPASEAIINPAGASFCSEEHRLRHSTP